MIKKITAIVLMLVLLSFNLNFANAEKKEEVSFVAKPSQVNTDYEFKIDVFVEDLGSNTIGGLNLSLCYDNIIFKVDNVSSELKGAAVKLREEESRVNFAWENTSEELKDGKKLFTVSFSCNKKPLGDEYLMSLSCLEIYDATENLGEVLYNTKVKPVNFLALKIENENSISAGQIILYAALFIVFVAVITVVYILFLNKKSNKKFSRERKTRLNNRKENKND